jgi:hypothetical protein
VSPALLVSVLTLSISRTEIVVSAGRVYFVETGVRGLDTFGSAIAVAGVVLAILRCLLAGAAARGLEADSCLASGAGAG